MGRKNRLIKSLIVILFFCFVNVHLVASVQANQTELSATKTTALAALGEAFEKISENAEEYQGYVDRVADFLPEDSINTLNAVITVAQLDISTEEKIDSLIETAQIGCSIFVQIWIVFWFFGWILGFLGFPLPALIFSLLSFLSEIGFWGMVLCLFGLI